MKLLYFLSSAGCLFWRSRQPGAFIKKRGLAEVKVIEGEYPDAKDIAEKVQWCDAICFQSPYSIDALVSIIKYKSLNKKVFVDFDDFPFECSYLNAHYRRLGMEDVIVKDPTTGQSVQLWKDGVDGFSIAENYKKQRSLLDILQIADLLTVTTDHLKERFIGIGADPARLRVVPNAVDFSRWKPIPNVRDKFPDAYRIGWTASASHGEDWFSIHATLKQFIDSHPGTKLVIMGDVGIDVDAKFPPEQLEWRDWSDIASGHYAFQCASLGVDVAICPLADNKFNKCKSSLKYVEMTAFGYPVIAQDMLPYTPVILHGIDGLLAGGKMSWMTALEVMRIPRQRSEMHINALIKCRAMFDLDRVCYEWADVYREFVDETPARALNHERIGALA